MLEHGASAATSQVTQCAGGQAPEGLPASLNAGIQALSGLDVSDVRVHPNSNRPAALGAQAFAQGNNIHLAPGQDQHLPHEAWHVVQQRQGRVRANLAVGEVPVNDEARLEHEADVMGAKALQRKVAAPSVSRPVVQLGKGKVERKKVKEAEEQKKKDRKIDPNNRTFRGGLNADVTGSKLDVSETQGGHARDRHAAKDNDYLEGRDLPIASTFDSEEDQNEALVQLLDLNRDKIAAWIEEQGAAKRLTISGEIVGISVSAVRRQKRVGVTSSGYEYPDPTVPRFVPVAEAELTQATAVLERYLLKSSKRGKSPTVHWKLITCFPEPADT